MPFTLDIITDAPAQRATLRLADDAGVHLATHEAALAAHPASFAALFDLRGHVRRMARASSPEAVVTAAGAFLAQHVLGPEITGFVASGLEARTLLVRLPAKDDPLAAAFARVPWEIARAPHDALTLLQRAVTVRAAIGEAEVGKGLVLKPDPGDPVRVLLVFADPPNARPLAARLERERLRDLFFGEVLPKRAVELDVLCHGVTRARLRELLTVKGGFHVIHWSGHGHVNALELADGGIEGDELVTLFREAGGFVPGIMFLGACHCGAMAEPKDWESLRRGVEDGARDAEAHGAGFVGTARSLVRAGVKQVVAMRWAVGDVYARRLGRRFHRHLLTDEVQYAADKALSLARMDLVGDATRKGEYDAVDHAAPMVFGGEAVRVGAEKRRSAQMDRRAPRPQPLLVSGSKELNPPWGFVGRGEELTRLFGEWMAAGTDKPIALIQGLAGLGKTSLAAEVIHLRYERFDYVFAFQVKGGALPAESFYRDLDLRLTRASKSYRDRNEMARVFVDTAILKGEERYDHLAYNLVDAMGAERILLVLDNFETNLLPGRECKDPAWTKLFEILSDKLTGTGSRVLVTSRHKPAVLAETALWIPIGPLPIAEARLYFQNNSLLRELWYGDDEAHQLATRILQVSHGHPLILARIANLASQYHTKNRGFAPAWQSEVERALTQIQGDGFRGLPDIFARAKSDAERAREHEYLDDVAVSAVDMLIGRLTRHARQLLWMTTRAGEPAREEMIAIAWGSSPAALLGELHASGLLTRENDVYAFHELVAERATEWMKNSPSDRAEKTEAEVWMLFGEWHGKTFDALRRSGKPGSRDVASEIGRRGIRYLVRARAYESLTVFASGVVTGTRDPMVLGGIVADLRAAAADAPTGEVRWNLRTCLADALRMAGQSDIALPLFSQAADEAEAAGHWTHLGEICHNWGNALRDVGHLDRAHQAFLRSADAARRANEPRLRILMSELAALRIEVMQGRAAEALPSIEERLGEVRAFWARRRRGEQVSEAPDGEMLARALVGGLNISRQANSALSCWQACIDLIDETEKVERARGMGEHEIARTRSNRYGPLMRLGKLHEARAVLEECLDTFRLSSDTLLEAKALTALASVWSKLADHHQAISFARQGLALFNRLPDPENRAVTHNNLAIDLHATGASAEGLPHQLATLVYRFATGHDLRSSREHLAERIGESAARGERFTLPPLATVLADPAFAPLGAFLQQRGEDPKALQARIDAFVEEVRAEAS